MKPKTLGQFADIEAGINEDLLPLANDRSAAIIPADRFRM
jgi:hypothetical protein